jgi:hypothetical protein
LIFDRLHGSEKQLNFRLTPDSAAANPEIFRIPVRSLQHPNARFFAKVRAELTRQFVYDWFRDFRRSPLIVQQSTSELHEVGGHGSHATLNPSEVNPVSFCIGIADTDRYRCAVSCFVVIERDGNDCHFELSQRNIYVVLRQRCLRGRSGHDNFQFYRIKQKYPEVQQEIGKNIFLKSPVIFDLPTRPNNDSIWFFEPKARRRFDRIFTNPQETAD